MSDGGDRGEQHRLAHPGEVRPAWPHQAVVDRLLDRDGHQHPPHRGAEGQQQRDGQADAELRRQRQAPAQRGPGPGWVRRASVIVVISGPLCRTAPTTPGRAVGGAAPSLSLGWWPMSEHDSSSERRHGLFTADPNLDDSWPEAPEPSWLIDEVAEEELDETGAHPGVRPGALDRVVRGGPDRCRSRRCTNGVPGGRRPGGAAAALGPGGAGARAGVRPAGVRAAGADAAGARAAGARRARDRPDGRRDPAHLRHPAGAARQRAEPGRDAHGRHDSSQQQAPTAERLAQAGARA